MTPADFVAVGDPFLLPGRVAFGVVLFVDEHRGTALVAMQSGHHGTIPLPVAAAGRAQLASYAEEIPSA